MNSMELTENINLLRGDCIDLLPKIPDGSIDSIITDPPYGYLKNQKLDIPFNEAVFFSEVKRVLKPAGFIVLFGRGTAFYRWNTLLADLGFVFKEEIIWNKVQTTSPVLPLSRVHETISIHCKGKGKINKVRVPYLEMKGHDIGAIKTDIKRLMSVFSNNKSLEAVRSYLETAERNYYETISTKNNNMLFSKKVKRNNRALCVFQGIQGELKEKSIIRNDRQLIDTMSKNEISVRKSVLSGDRACNCMQAINEGFSEKSIINFYNERYAAKHTIATSKHMKNADRDLLVMQAVTEGCVEKSIMQQGREHYTMQHPTQKPARLLERLMALVTQENALVLDPFMGSASTGVACINTDRRFIGIELDDNYFAIAKHRIEKALKEKRQNLFGEHGEAVNA
jgi:DNA (cytosine-5-)-methyltransferase